MTPKQAAYRRWQALQAEHEEYELRLIGRCRETGRPPEQADPWLWALHMDCEAELIFLEATAFTEAELRVLLDPEATDADREAMVAGGGVGAGAEDEAEEEQVGEAGGALDDMARVTAAAYAPRLKAWLFPDEGSPA